MLPKLKTRKIKILSKVKDFSHLKGNSVVQWLLFFSFFFENNSTTFRSMEIKQLYINYCKISRWTKNLDKQMILIFYMSTTKLKYKSQKKEKYQESTIFPKNIKEETHNKL